MSSNIPQSKRIKLCNNQQSLLAFAVPKHRNHDMTAVDDDILHFQAIIDKYNIPTSTSNYPDNRTLRSNALPSTAEDLSGLSSSALHKIMQNESKAHEESPEPVHSGIHAQIPPSNGDLIAPISVSSTQELDPYLQQRGWPLLDNLLHYGIAYSHRHRCSIHSNYRSRLVSRLYSSHFSLLPWQFAHFNAQSSPIGPMQPYISALEFDSAGCVLAACSSNGKMRVFGVDLMVAQFSALKIATKSTNPVLVEQQGSFLEFSINNNISTGNSGPSNGFKVENFHWNGRNEDEFAVCSSKSSEILLFNVQQSNLNRPLRAIRPNSSIKAPLIDFSYINQGNSGQNQLISALLRTGQLCLFDLRANLTLNIYNPSDNFTRNSNFYGHHSNTADISPVNLLNHRNQPHLQQIMKENAVIEAVELRMNRLNPQSSLNCAQFRSKEGQNGPKLGPIHYSTVNPANSNEILLQTSNSGVIFADRHARTSLLLQRNGHVYGENLEEMYKRKKNCCFLHNYSGNSGNSVILTHSGPLQQIKLHSLSQPSTLQKKQPEAERKGLENYINPAEFDEVVEFPAEDAVEANRGEIAVKSVELLSLSYNTDYHITNLQLNSVAAHPHEPLLFAGFSNNCVLAYGHNVEATSSDQLE
jgi:hypothetical protein